MLQRKITDDLSVGVELNHESADAPDDRDSSAFNVGATYKITEHLKIYASAGRGIQNAEQTNKYSWYLGLSATGGEEKASPKPKEKVEVSHPFSEWSGFYVGAGAGLARWHVRETNTLSDETDALSDFPPISATLYGTRIFGGPFSGVNWRFGQIVFGVETEVAADGDLSARQRFGATLAPRVDAQAWGRGRIGLPVDRFLFFGSGGAVGQNFFASAFGTSFDAAHVGWTVGGGVDYALDAHWAARIEFRHAEFGGIQLDSGHDDRASARWRPRQNSLHFGALYRFDFLPPGLD